MIITVITITIIITIMMIIITFDNMEGDLFPQQRNGSVRKSHLHRGLIRIAPVEDNYDYDDDNDNRREAWGDLCIIIIVITAITTVINIK